MKINFLLILLSVSIGVSGCGKSKAELEKQRIGEKKQQERIAKADALAAQMAAAKQPHHKPQIHAYIEGDDTCLTIRNSNNFDWPELTVYISGMPPFTYG
jgi:hypothetical protein